VCGKRARLSAPVCPQHGPCAPEPLAEDFGSGEGPAIPRFPGYRTVAVLGRGGFGVVFAAQPEEGGPTAAVKVARADGPDAGPRLLRELTVLREVGPPHVPAIYGDGALPDGSPYIVMEHVAAPTLADRLVSGAPPIAVEEARALALGTLRALSAVHARGFVHCDLKPENVFVCADGHAVIVDFGLAASAVEPPGDRASPPPAAEGLERTIEAPVAGTAEYMAPEQCEGREGIDARTDVYAMGVILYELLAGAPPFWGPPAAVRQGHLASRPPRMAPPPGRGPIPRALEAIVERCLAKDPHDRFESAAALAEALAAVPAEEEAPAAPRKIAEPRARDERRTVGLLFFQAEAGVVSIRERIAPIGGHLAHTSGVRHVVIFGHDGGDNPARRAYEAAQELVQRGVCARVRLDVGTVTKQTRPDGSSRFLSPLFARAERYPTDADPEGVAVSEAAAAVLPDAGVPPPPQSTRGSLPSLSELPSGIVDTTPFVGRDGVVAALVESARAAAREAVPTAATVTAEPGHGKTRLLREIAERLRGVAPAGEVIELRARRPGAAATDQTVGELLERTLDLPPVAPIGGGAALLRERLDRLGVREAAPAVAAALGWLGQGEADSTLASGMRALEVAPGAVRNALATAAGEALRRRAADRPVFVLLDDAHQAGDVTLAALEYATLAESPARLWVCALGRPELSVEHPSWGERAGRSVAHRLGPLDRADAAALCRSLLLPVEDVPDTVVERLVDRARAVPLLLVELVRGLKLAGHVRRRPKGEGLYLATDELDHLPDLPLVDWLASDEIDALPPALRAHARLAALLGNDVTIGDMEGVLRRLEEQGAGAEFPLDAKIGARRLLAAGVLVKDRQGRLAFRHTLVREAIVKQVPKPTRRRIHLAAAEHYRAFVEPAPPGAPPPGPGLGGAAGAGEGLAQLAYHAAEAGLSVLAACAYRDLAERMRARHAYVEAERCYSRALEQLGPSGDAALHRGRGLMRLRVGRQHDALADFAEARALARRAGDVRAEIETLLDEATVLDWISDFKSSEERVMEARALAPQIWSPEIEARALLGVGRSLHRFSREEEAASVLEAAADAAGELGDLGYETQVIALLMLGFIYPGLGRLGEAKATLDRMIALAEEHADTFHLAGAMNNRALLWAFLGDRAAMIADFGRELALARALGQPELELYAVYNLGEYLYLMDDLDAAAPHVQRALGIARRLSGEGGRAVVTLLDARLRFYRGEEAAARALVAGIRAQEEEARARGQTDGLMVPSEDVLASMIELATSDADDEAWDELEGRAARYSVGQERIEVLEARAIAAQRRGRRDEAALRFAAALELAARIPNVMRARLEREMGSV
jgi:tetratricopeptide (TPR) repeat protein